MKKRLNRLALLIRSFFIFIIRGKAIKKSETISRILVVLTGKLGDTICGTPVLKAIRTHLPEAHIVVAGAMKLQQAVLSHSGLVDEYLDLEHSGALMRVKNAKADVAIITGPSYMATVLSYNARIPLVIAPTVVGGFSPAETRLYKILKKFITTFPYHIYAYAPRERLKSLEPIGIISDNTKKILGFSEDAKNKIKKFFSENSTDPEKDFIVGVSPSSGNIIKEWPEERFAGVIDYVATKHQAKIFILGSPKEKDKINRTINFLKSGVKVIQITDFNIDELKAFISKLSLFIASDTGPIYIAEAFNVPTIDIVGPVDERVQPPQGFIHRNVVPPNRTRAEVFILNARGYNKEEATRQTLSITVSAVTEVIDKLILDLRK